MAYDPRNDGNSPQYQPAGIGSPGDNRGMGQYIADELPQMIRTRTLAELQELLDGLKNNYKNIGLNTKQKDQAVAMVEQRISQLPRQSGPVADTQGYGLRTRDVDPPPGAVPVNETVTTQAIPEAPAESIEARARRAAAERSKRWADDGRRPGPMSIAESSTGQPLESFLTAEPALSEAVPTLEPGPLKEFPNGQPGPLEEFTPPREGKKTDKSYDGMTVEEFMKVGDVVHIAINGKGLRNDGGKFVPVGR